MTRNMLMYERYFHDEQSRRYHLQYFLLIDEVVFGCNTLEVYGAEIRAFRDGTFYDKRVIRGITPFGPRITSILNCLADGLVTPACMRDVVCDMLCA